MGNNFLEKSVDLSKVDLIITFPGIGTYMIKEAKEIDNIQLKIRIQWETPTSREMFQLFRQE